MKLNDLPPQRQQEIVQQRKADMKALREHAFRTMDPIALATLELDAQAKLLGVDVNYSEELDEDEIE